MLYPRRPTDDELRELERMNRQEVGRVSRRAHMVLSSIRRKMVPERAAILDVCCAVGRFRIERFNAEGRVGLYDRARSGRPLFNGNRLASVRQRIVPTADYVHNPIRKGQIHPVVVHILQWASSTRARTPTYRSLVRSPPVPGLHARSLTPASQHRITRIHREFGRA